jgi:hypothetical protein
MHASAASLDLTQRRHGLSPRRPQQRHDGWQTCRGEEQYGAGYKDQGSSAPTPKIIDSTPSPLLEKMDGPATAEADRPPKDTF